MTSVALEAAPMARAVGRPVVVFACGLGLVTALLALLEPHPDALLRHAYLPLVVVAGVKGGAGAGIASAVAAVLLDAPFVLSSVERAGLSQSAIEGLTSFVVLIVVGASTGALATWARRERDRADLLLALPHALAGDVGLEDAVERARAAIATALRADVAVVIDNGGRRVVAGRVEAAAADVDAVLADGRCRWIADVGGDMRPRRVLVVPVVAAVRSVGALAVARTGEISGAERSTVVALGVYLGLALENARLGAAQRRFAAELAGKVAAATRELASMDRAKSAFVAVASHELRTPLTALRGFSELLAVRAFADEDVRRFARVMQEETERLSRIVDDLLDLSRVEQGLGPPLRRTAVDPASAIRRVAALFDRPPAPSAIVVDVPPGLGAVHADPDALDRILKNLVANAVKYAGTAPITIGARPSADAVEFAVEDRGPGVPADALPRLFEPYFRARDGEGGAAGTGLGLAIVRALVEAHGGAVHVTSTPDVGTRVCFTMPPVS